MFLLLSLIPALLAAILLGGKLSRVFEYPWRAPWLIWASIGIQIPLFSPLTEDWSRDAVAFAHVGTYVPLLIFLALNLASGLGLMLTGTICNLIPIIANGGHMPVDPRAWKSAFPHKALTDGDAMNTVVTGDHRLLFLGDVMALPSRFPFANAFSIGDVLLALGLGYAFCRLSLNAPPIGRVLARDVTRLWGVLGQGGRLRAACLTTLADWMIVAGAAGWAATQGSASLVSAVLAARFVAGVAARALGGPESVVRLAPYLAGAAALAMAWGVQSGQTAVVLGATAMLGAARGFCAGTRELGRVPGADLDRALLAASLASRGAMALGLGAGSVVSAMLGAHISLVLGAIVLVVSGAITATESALVAPRSPNADLRAVASRYPATRWVVLAAALAAAIAAAAGPLLIAGAASFGDEVGAAGWFLASGAVGLFAGQLAVWSFAQTGRDGAGAFGLALAGLALACGLGAAADLTATLACAAGVAGLALGAMDALLRLQVARTGDRLMWQVAATALGGGIAAGLATAAIFGTTLTLVWWGAALALGVGTVLPVLARDASSARRAVARPA